MKCNARPARVDAAVAADWVVPQALVVRVVTASLHPEVPAARAALVPASMARATLVVAENSCPVAPVVPVVGKARR